MNHLWRGKIFTICGPVLGGRTLVGLTYAVGLMSYFGEHGASGPLIHQGPSKGHSGPRWRGGTKQVRLSN